MDIERIQFAVGASIIAVTREKGINKRTKKTIIDTLREMEEKLTIDLGKMKLECVACNGSGWYDSCDEEGNPIPCGACDGTGYED